MKKYTLTLINKKVKTTIDALNISANSMLSVWDSDQTGFQEYIESVREAVRSRMEIFSEVDEVYFVLTNAPFKKDKQGVVEQGQSGPTQIPWKIDEVRKNSYIKRLIEDALAKAVDGGLEEYEIDKISIEIDADHAYHLGKLMVERLRFSNAAGEHIVDFYDRMVDMEADMQKVVKKQEKSSSDEDSP